MTWSQHELERIDSASELRIASYRADGTLRPYTTIWHRTLGDALYVRSAHGPGNGWFQRARSAGRGRIRASGVDKDVTFEIAAPDIHTELDRALHEKYDRFGPGPVGAITGVDVLETTLKVMPAQ